MNVRCVLLIASVLFAAPMALAQKPAGHPAAPAPAGKADEKKATFAVVAIGEDMKVMNENAVEALQKEKKKAHDEAMAAWEKAKKAATDAKKPFDKAAPKEETVKVEKGGFATEAEAKKYLDEMQAKKKAGGADHGKKH